jgi:hypothetical protein
VTLKIICDVSGARIFLSTTRAVPRWAEASSPDGVVIVGTDAAIDKAITLVRLAAAQGPRAIEDMYEGPTLFVNSDAFVNTARLHTDVPLECSWYDSYQHWWCVRFKRSAALLSVWTLLHQCVRCLHSPLCLQTPMAPGTPPTGTVVPSHPMAARSRRRRHRDGDRHLMQVVVVVVVVEAPGLTVTAETRVGGQVRVPALTAATTATAITTASVTTTCGGTVVEATASALETARFLHLAHLLPTPRTAAVVVVVAAHRR